MGASLPVASPLPGLTLCCSGLALSPSAQSSQLGRADRLAGWRRGKRQGPVVAGEDLVLLAPDVDAQELRAGGNRDVGARRMALADELQGGLARDRRDLALDQVLELAAEGAGELARTAPRCHACRHVGCLQVLSLQVPPGSGGDVVRHPLP